MFLSIQENKTNNSILIRLELVTVEALGLWVDGYWLLAHAE